MSMVRVLMKHGCFLKAKKKVLIIFNCLKKFEGLNDLGYFFKVIMKNCYLPVILRVRVVAGRKILIPSRVSKENEIKFLFRFILKSLKERSERSLEKRIEQEFIDIYKNKGITLRRRGLLYKDIKENIPNLRFLRF